MKQLVPVHCVMNQDNLVMLSKSNFILVSCQIVSILNADVIGVVWVLEADIRFEPNR